MPDRDKLLRKAKTSRNNLRYTELCQLAESYGFVLDRQNGSHASYVHPKYKQNMTFQEKNGKAKAYQVDQLLKAIAELEAEAEEDTDA